MKKTLVLFAMMLSVCVSAQIKVTKEGYPKFDNKQPTTTVSATDTLMISKVDGIQMGISFADFTNGLSGTTYTAGNGIDITSGVISANQTLSEVLAEGSVITTSMSVSSNEAYNIGSSLLRLNNIYSAKSHVKELWYNPTDAEPSNPVEGQNYWDDSENRLKAYDGTSWKAFLLDGDVSGGSSDAEDITYNNTTSGLTATDVQGAIDEIAGSASSADKDVKYINYIDSDITLSNSNVNNGVKEVLNIVKGNRTLTLDNSITLNKYAYFQPDMVGDTITIDVASGVKLRGSGNIPIDTTMTVGTLKVTDVENFSLLKTNDNVYSVAGNFTAELTYLTRPNDSNPNPELITGDAVSFAPNEANAITNTGVINSGVDNTSEANTSHGYNAQYVRRVTANTTGTLRRTSIAFTGVNGTSYDIDIVKRAGTGGSGRYYIATNVVTPVDTIFTNTDWDIDSFTIVCNNSSTIRIELYGYDDNSTIGDWSEYLVSVKEAE